MAAQIPIAAPRSRPWKVAVMMESDPGSSMAEPSPCRARNAMSCSVVCDSPQASDPSTNTTSPVVKNRLRPNRSPSAPPVSMNDAKVRVYASISHCSCDTPAPSERWMVGRATFTTRLSSMGMNSPNTMVIRTHHFLRSPLWP